ncbi:MAG: phosphogluconate dehydrogenase (NAD(+)-dependent, decarboxylating) [Candidatus Bathyarchaeia archaeon]|jgi:6-phosphogluconate dehydrogenase
MELGIIGLGRMGANIARRLSRGGHKIIVYNRTIEKAIELANKEPKITAVKSLGDFARVLSPQRAVWVMVPAGEPTEQMVDDLLKILSKGDIIIDGGNSYYKDTMRRAEKVSAAGLNFIDVGTSGGVWGLDEGYSMMVGGDKVTVDHLQPIFETLAPGPKKGWGHVGPNGAGHFVKMVHNGIEYGAMEAYAEGFEILRAKKEFNLDLHQVAEVWRYGSVIRSWLLDLTSSALEEDQNLTHIKGWVADSGEGRWTISEAIDLAVPASVITLSLFRRFASRQDESYAAKLLAAMRNKFGGHAIETE